MASRRRRRRNRNRFAGFLTLSVGAAAAWWFVLREPAGDGDLVSVSLAASSQQPEPPKEGETDAPSTSPVNPPASQPDTQRESGAPSQPPTSAPSQTATEPAPKAAPAQVNTLPTPTSGSNAGAAALALKAREAASRHQTVEARTLYSQALRMGAAGSEAESVRAELSRLSEESLLGPQVIDGDPLASRYVIQTGDTLEKIATKFKLSPEFLAEMNRIADKNRIRAGQTLKALNGPFRAEVDAAAYALDLYLGDVFVKRFRVGLGQDDSTPRGEWRVGTKLKNPTYYPPRGGKIVAADDPENPLGERWIALEGVSGEAVGQQRYGIHGTNEPDSIGKSVSLGCVRLNNTDVEQVYNYLVSGHSTVIVK